MLKNNCFKGWYFKCSSNDKTIAFIIAYHISDNNKSFSMQIITNNNVINIPLNSLKYSENPLCISTENCAFSENGIKLNIRYKNMNINGELRFQKLSPIKYDIMGPFQFVPFMQCRHTVYSMRHTVDGEISINGNLINFQNGIGYIEGDKGRSFPKRYIWTQCCFENGSLMLSVADIPLLGFHFTGIICIILIDGKEYRIATYLGAKLKYIEKNTVSVKQGDLEFTAKLIEKNDQSLYAPNNGKMNRTIHESAACKAFYDFSRKGKPLLRLTSERASFEFEYN